MTPYGEVERAARESYGRLLAYLAARTRDLAAAEDALADAFAAALERWPRDGVPARPEAWLLTTARRKLIDQARHTQVAARTLPTLGALADQAYELAADDSHAFPDDRLALLFVCAHPGIDPAARTPLMLQTVLGLDAARIASAFVVQPATMGQRLSRAKARIRDAGLLFELPSADELAGRLTAVLEAIYAAFGSGWDDIAGADPRRRGLAVEAVHLGQVLAALLPDEPEVHGLLALMLYCDARRGARRGTDGAYVPLSSQRRADWSATQLESAEHHLRRAAALSLRQEPPSSNGRTRSPGGGPSGAADSDRSPAPRVNRTQESEGESYGTASSDRSRDSRGKNSGRAGGDRSRESDAGSFEPASGDRGGKSDGGSAGLAGGDRNRESAGERSGRADGDRGCMPEPRGGAGRFQLEAAIQSAHMHGADWATIALLYEGLVRHAPTLGALVGRAAAAGQAGGPQAGWRLLQEIPETTRATYQPYWAVAAHLLTQLEDREAAEHAYDRAIGLCTDSAVRDFLIHARSAHSK